MQTNEGNLTGEFHRTEGGRRAHLGQQGPWKHFSATDGGINEEPRRGVEPLACLLTLTGCSYATEAY